MINTDKLSEDVHYTLIPADGANNEQAWDVRILEGEFVETVIRFGNISFNGKDDCLNFNFSIISTPDSSLTVDDTNFQLYAGEVLESILEKSISDGSLITKDIND